MCHVRSLAVPIEGSVILGKNQVLDSMKPDGKPLPGKPPSPCIWVREYDSKSGKKEARLRHHSRGFSGYRERRIPSFALSTASFGAWAWNRISRVT